MAFAGLLEHIFLNLSGGNGGTDAATSADGACADMHGDLVAHVVDATYNRLRLAPGHARKLGEPIARTLRYIDDFVESVPGPVLCSRSTFVEDPCVNALFVNPQHVQEVFSQSEDVRSLFSANAAADDCWALLCMNMRESTEPGMALVDGEVRRDVMQTSISFADHQVVSPGIEESAARRALKCCVFEALLSHIRGRISVIKTRNEELLSRLHAAKAKQRRALQRHGVEGTEGAALQDQIRELEQQLMSQEAPLSTVAEHLDFVVGILSRPEDFISTERCFLRLDRRAVKLESGARDGDYDFEVARIRIAAQGARVGALVRFPRDQLLPEPDILRRADLFLAV